MRRSGRCAFQSPSLRGSGRFSHTLQGEWEWDAGFNPLHCGAVVASGSGWGGRDGAHPRFNPLHCGAVVASERAKAEARAGGAGFNPLHCGAVVASLNRFRHIVRTPPVSIPFIAGQWSLQPAPDPAAERAAVSIPFIAGQWSLQEAERRAAKAGVVSIPFIAGQWSLPAVCGGVLLAAQIVSIPFIAGQWSLLFECPLAERRGARSFNPLHCGAVVASILCATSSLVLMQESR